MRNVPVAQYKAVAFRDWPVQQINRRATPCSAVKAVMPPKRVEPEGAHGLEVGEATYCIGGISTPTVAHPHTGTIE
jgi:hypothetical protein